MSEKLITMELSQAERQLIEILRHQDAQDFTLTVHVDNDRAHSNSSAVYGHRHYFTRFDIRLEDHDLGKSSTGSGPDFDTAWDNVLPASATIWSRWRHTARR